MNKAQTKLVAEILVEMGYAIGFEVDKREHLKHNPPIVIIKILPNDTQVMVECNITSDTLEARRQHNVVENWLHQHHKALLNEAKNLEIKPLVYNGREKRMKRTLWSLDQLTGDK